MIPRYGMSLRIVHHLELVFHIAEKDVSSGERVALILRDQTLFAQRLKSFQGVAMADLGQSRSMPNLEGLRNEFDFTDTTCSELDVPIALLTGRHLLIH